MTNPDEVIIQRLKHSWSDLAESDKASMMAQLKCSHGIKEIGRLIGRVPKTVRRYLEVATASPAEQAVLDAGGSVNALLRKIGLKRLPSRLGTSYAEVTAEVETELAMAIAEIVTKPFPLETDDLAIRVISDLTSSASQYRIGPDLSVSPLSRAGYIMHWEHREALFPGRSNSGNGHDSQYLAVKKSLGSWLNEVAPRHLVSGALRKALTILHDMNKKVRVAKAA